MRITAQLIDSETGHHVWAERYDRELHDIFALQDEITERIAAIIEPAIAGSEQKRLTSRRAKASGRMGSLHLGLFSDLSGDPG